MSQMSILRRPALAALLVASGVPAMAVDLPDFTFNPGGAGLTGAAFTADNIIISDYGTVTLSGTSFTDSGFLAVNGFQLNSQTITPTGLNTTYGLYFTYSGVGTTTAGNVTQVATNGTFTSLTFSLYGYSGSAATFSPTTVTGATNAVLLGTGTLLPGAGNSAVSTSPLSPSLTANAAANASFATVVSGFFTSPNPFYNLVTSSFTNTASEITPAANGNGFTIQQGGGSVNFAVSAVPEPGTYATLLLGLGAIGVGVRRRRMS